jgi:hypothetical protein
MGPSTFFDDMNEFQLFHAYNRLVREGKAQPLTCSCDTEYVTGLGYDDELILWCYTCDTKTRPGENTIARVRGAVGEWIL